MDCDPDGAGASPGDGGNVGDVQAEDHAQGHKLGLVGGEGGYQAQSHPGGITFEGDVGGVRGGSGRRLGGVDGVSCEGFGSSRGAAGQVPGMVAGDDDKPAAKALLVTAE